MYILALVSQHKCDCNKYNKWFAAYKQGAILTWNKNEPSQNQDSQTGVI